jgi:hypothetical protein
MHPVFHQVFVNEKVRGLERATALAHLTRPNRPPITDEPVALRLCRVHDGEALLRLAELEGRPLPAGSFVVAEINGAIVAALPLAGGAPLADPFRPTSQIIPLLRLRAEQLTRAERARGRQIRLRGILSRS